MELDKSNEITVVRSIGNNLSDEKCIKILENWRSDIRQKMKQDIRFFMGQFKSSSFVIRGAIK